MFVYRDCVAKAKAKGNEAWAYEAVLNGTLEIDAEGRIWRLKVANWDRHSGLYVIRPVERRRAEHWTGRYYQVMLMREGVKANVLAHRLVWYHFYGSISPEITVNHDDGDGSNNRPSNLELATSKRQSEHMKVVLGVTREGESNPAAVLTEEDVRTIRGLRSSGLSIAAIVPMYEVSRSTIEAIVYGRTWKSLL